MEYTRFGDSIVMTHNSKKYRERLYTQIDTNASGYVAQVDWTVVSPETIGSGANARTRVRRIPQQTKINVPFTLGNEGAKALLLSFFSGFDNLNLPTGVTALQSAQDMEPLGSIIAAVNAAVNIVELPASDTFPRLIDEDLSDNE